MLFISILLSVWFAIWLMKSIFVRDTLKLIVSWLMEDSDDNAIDPLLEKTEEKTVYHLSCDHCNRMWWSIEPLVNYCPFCGKKPHDTKL